MGSRGGGLQGGGAPTGARNSVKKWDLPLSVVIECENSSLGGGGMGTLLPVRRLSSSD